MNRSWCNKASTAAIIMVLLIPGLLLSCCSPSSTLDKSINKLEGVYATSFEDIDFSMEITGRLSEDATTASAAQDDRGTGEINEKVSDNSVLYKPGMYSNKLLRWGISRRKNRETPAADPGAPELLKKHSGVYIGDTSKSIIYFTFDEGYENGYTPLILDTLRDNGVKAVFFITGPYLKNHQDLVRRMVEEGHMIGNHTVHHPSLPELDDGRLEEEVLGLERAFCEKFGQNMHFLRPPKGEYSERTLALTHKLGYCNLFWSFAYDDWYRDKTRGPQYAYEIVMRNLHNGAVLLLHAVSRDNAEALDSIIKGVLREGYSIGDPCELLPPDNVGVGIYEE
ncbi:MAG: polysaccharide deacetylase family protein [Bacillota bacterium]